MNSLPLLITVALAITSCGLLARDAPQSHDHEYRASESLTYIGGMEVRNLQNEKLGTIEYTTVDLENGRLVEVVVRSGGFLGMGTRKTAVPPRALSLDNSKRFMRLDVSKTKFDAAPRFDKSHMATATQRERVAEVNRYFGLEPWFFTEGQVVKKNAQILKLGYVHRTDRILNLQIRNMKGESIGIVDNLMTDLPKGRIVHVVVRTDARDSSLSIIQPRALRFNAAHDGLVLDNSFAEMAGEPHLKWNDGNDSFRQESYVNRDVEADNGRHSRQNANEGIVSKSNPMEQGQNFRDKQKTARIKQAIEADSSLSANARNVEVVTLNAQTTLRGHVNSAAGKRKIGEIAASAGRPENVSNLLEVR